MRFQGGETTAVLRTVVERVRDQNLTFLAGSLAYNAFVSLIPLLVLVLLVAGTVGNEVFTTRVETLSQSYLTAGAQEEISGAIEDSGGRVGLSLTGLVILLWGALKLFRGLDTAFSEVYDTERDQNVFKQFRDGIVAFVTIVLSFIALALAGTAFAYFRLPLLHVLNPLLLLVGLTLAFLPMYYVFPDVEMTVRSALPGAVVAAGGWAILEVVFQVYASYASQYRAYGVIGAILLLLTWLYFGGFVILVGAAVNAVIREHEQEQLAAVEAATDPETPEATDTARTGEAADATEMAAADATDAEWSTTTHPALPAAAREVGGADAATPASARTAADGDTATELRAAGRSERETRDRAVRNVAAAFAVGVVVGLVTVVATLVRLAR